MAEAFDTTSERRPPIVLGARIARVPLAELEGLLEAYRCANIALLAVANQPRMEEKTLNIIEDERTRLAWLCTEVEQEARRRVPINREEADLKARILVQWALECGDGWSEIAIIAAQGLREQATIN